MLEGMLVVVKMEKGERGRIGEWERQRIKSV
jgi:hypothetical protein